MQEIKQHNHYNYKDLSTLFSLLSSELRLKIIHLLCQNESTVGEIVAQVDATKFNVSQQLRQLEQGGIIERKKLGRFVYCKLNYTINREQLEQLRSNISTTVTSLHGSNRIKDATPSILCPI